MNASTELQRELNASLLEAVKNAYEARAELFRRGEWTREEMLKANAAIQRASKEREVLHVDID